MKGHGVCLGNAADSAEPQRHKEDAPSPAPGQLALFSSGREGEVEGHAAHEWHGLAEASEEILSSVPLPSQCSQNTAGYSPIITSNLSRSNFLTQKQLC